MNELTYCDCKVGKCEGKEHSRCAFIHAKTKGQSLPIDSVSKRSWHIGENVVVTHCIYGHEFDNGTTVKIVDHEPSQTTSWLCSDGRNQWWLSEEEGYVC